MSIPVIVSFYAGGPYYHDCAARLRADCVSLGLKHEIVLIEKPAEIDWADICRLKIRFYKDMLDRHPEGILWVDVDSRVIRRPTDVSNEGYDFGAFLRNFKSFKEYDPAVFGRKFHPGFVSFTSHDKSRAFVDHLQDVESSSTVKATDDYFLEEAFRTFDQDLSINIFSKDLIAFSDKDAESKPGACFIFGSSGNVSAYIDKVEQHTADFFLPRRERATLIRQFREAARRGRRDEALALIRAAFRIEPTHADTAIIYVNFLERLGNWKETVHILRQAFGPQTNDTRALRSFVEAYLQGNNAASARQFLNRLKDDPDQAEYVESRRYRVGLELRALKLGLSPEARPQLWWMETPFPGNFGDVLNPYIVEKLTGIPPARSKQGDGILAIGSVIKFAKKGTIVWGTGTPRMTDVLHAEADYRSVRGPLTRQLVIESGGQAPEIYGDAAMLLPLVKASAHKKYKLGLIRHYTHKAENLQLSDDVLDIDIVCVGEKGIEDFIRNVTSCEAIISTSLHGLIIAHAYGIPTRRAIFSQSLTQIPGDGTKFSDHYQAFGIKELPAWDLSKLGTLSSHHAIGCKEITTKPIFYKDILDAAPFPILAPVALAAERLQQKSIGETKNRALEIQSIMLGRKHFASEATLSGESSAKSTPYT